MSLPSRLERLDDRVKPEPSRTRLGGEPVIAHVCFFSRSHSRRSGAI